MNSYKTLVLTLFCFSLTANASQLDFPKTGYSIDSLEAEPSQSISNALHMFLPPENGFSGNVNVMLQPYSGSLEEYKALSEAQFKQLNLEMILSFVSQEQLTFEYKGTMQGKMLHWYAKAYKKGDIIYLVTATDAQINWEKNKGQLSATVDSFTLK